MSYRDTLIALGERNASRVVAAFNKYQDGEISHAEAVALIAAIIARGNSYATALADLSLASTLMLQLGNSVNVVGVLPPPEDPERLAKAAATLLAIAGVTAERIARLAKSEVLSAAANAYSAALDAQPGVTGWTRSAEPNACPVCTDLADGTTLPTSVPMWHHPGCTCTQTPITD